MERAGLGAAQEVQLWCTAGSPRCSRALSCPETRLQAQLIMLASWRIIFAHMGPSKLLS